MPTLPTLFLSHGSPMRAVEPGEPGAAWSAIARTLPRPRAVLMVSAHWETSVPMVTANAKPETIHDFGGFPEALYRIRYPAPGAPDVAARVVDLLKASGITAGQDGCRGIDHGAWVPLKVMYPDADVPVLQLSLPTHDPSRLLDIGRRIAELRTEGTLVIGSGFLTHGLPFLTREHWTNRDAAPPSWSTEFDAWAGEALSKGDVDELAAFTEKAPGMPYAHPTVEHFTPLFVTLGAATAPDAPVSPTVDGFWLGLSKRSFQVV